VSDTPGLDAQVLLAHILGKPRSWILAHPELFVSDQQFEVLESYHSRLIAGEPLPYVLGHWEFYGLDFCLSSDVLIPRPETELLVEHASSWLEEREQESLVADVGTGSGCIAVSLAVHHPNVKILASDISIPGLYICKKNALCYQVDRQVFCLNADLLPAIRPKFDLICANLPYIPTSMLARLAISRWEPTLALDGGENGLELIQRLLHQAKWILAPGGMILLEIEASQGEEAASLAQMMLPSKEVSVLVDLSGHDRLIKIFTPE